VEHKKKQKKNKQTNRQTDNWGRLANSETSTVSPLPLRTSNAERRRAKPVGGYGRFFKVQISKRSFFFRARSNLTRAVVGPLYRSIACARGFGDEKKKHFSQSVRLLEEERTPVFSAFNNALHALNVRCGLCPPPSDLPQTGPLPSAAAMLLIDKNNTKAF
jgi:hypothetical protein